MKLLAFLILFSGVGWAQQPPACTWKATATVSGAQVSFPNNTASPICNAFALSWNSTGFSGVSIELQGSDNNASWTTFTGTSTVLVGTNPQTGLTGTIIIQASATLAFIRVNLTSLTGSGSVSYQIYGYNGVTPAAKTGGGGSGGTCAALGGDLSGTCTAATVVGVNGAAVPASATLTGTNSSKQIIAATLPNADIYVGSAGNLPVGVAVSGDVGLANDGTMTVSGTSGLMLPALAQVLGTNISRQIIPAPLGAGQIFVGNVSNVPAAVTPSGNVSMSNIGAFTVLGVITGAGATTTTNGNLIYDTTANNLHAANNSGDAIVPVTTVTPGNGNCASWLNSGGNIKLGDAGSACGSGGGGGGGVITYSSSADTFLGTQFLPPGGGAPASSTESDVQVASPAAATVSNLHVQISSALGVGATSVFTWRDAGSSTSSTCTISGASAVSCADTTHSFNVAAGDLLDMQVVTTGTPGVVNALFTSAFGTSNVGVTAVTASLPIVSSGGTTPVISCPTCGTGTGGSNITFGTYASLPGTCAHSSSASDAYYPTDSYYQFLCTATNTFSPFADGKQMVLPAAASNWTTVNGSSGTATAADSNGAVVLSTSAGVLGAEAILRPIPSTPYVKTILIRYMSFLSSASTGGSGSDQSPCGVLVTNGTSTSSSMQMVRVTNQANSPGFTSFGSEVAVQHYTSFAWAGFAADATLLWANWSLGQLWGQISDNGTTRTYAISNDGVKFITIFSVAHGTPFTPTNYGVFCGQQNTIASGTPASLPWEITLLSDN